MEAAGFNKDGDIKIILGCSCDVIIARVCNYDKAKFANITTL